MIWLEECCGSTSDRVGPGDDREGRSRSSDVFMSLIDVGWCFAVYYFSLHLHFFCCYVLINSLERLVSRRYLPNAAKHI